MQTRGYAPRLAAAVLAALAFEAGAGAEEPALETDAAAAQPAAGPPAVGLDQLLKLPSTGDYSAERKGGLTRGEWRSRYNRIQTSLDREQAALDASEKELDHIAGSADQWLVGPPGMTNTDAPLDYRLRQEINRHKDEVDRLKKEKRDTDVAANLAGVPQEWRE